MRWISAMAIVTIAHAAAAQTFPVPVVQNCTPVQPAAPSTYILQTVLYETTSDGQNEYLDLYTPIGIAKPTMAMVVHGGGFVAGDKASGSIVSLALGMVSLGWQVASINYRLAGANGFANLFPAPLQDAACALHWLRTNGLGDHRRIVVAGLSAGGGIANWIGTISRQENPAYLSPTCGADHDTADHVIGIASFYGFSDYTNPAVYNSLQNLNNWDTTIFGFTIAQNPSALAAASPVANIDSQGPVYFMSDGLDDTVILPAQVAEFGNATQAAGVPTNLIQVPGAGHGFGAFSSSVPESSCTFAAWLSAIQAIRR